MVFPLKKYPASWRSLPRILCAAILIASGSARAIPARVILVNSAPRVEYEQTTGVIISSLEQSGLDLTVEKLIFNNNSTSEDEFWDKVIEKQPELIITMGTPATRSAIENTENIPIIFTVVLDNIGDLSQKSKFSDIAGITLEIPVRKQLEMMHSALPDIRRVGYIYSSSSERVYQTARNIMNAMDLRLVGVQIAGERDIPSALRRIISEVDVLWMPPDAVIYLQPNIFRFILLECYKNSVPIMAVSKRIAIAGTPLSLGIDYEDIGRQTAELVLKRLSGKPFRKPVVEHPQKVLLFINEGVVSRLGLSIPPKIIEQSIPVQSWR
jgi:putative tryptophan/tyrosine transport system substrate-binding protein